VRYVPHSIKCSYHWWSYGPTPVAYDGAAVSHNVGRIHTGRVLYPQRGMYRQEGRHIDSRVGILTARRVYRATGQVYQQQAGVSQRDRCIDRRRTYRQQGGVSTMGRVYRQEAGISTTGRAWVYRPQAGHINNGAGVSTTGRAYQQQGGCIDTRRAYRQQGGRIDNRRAYRQRGWAYRLNSRAGTTSMGQNDTRRCFTQHAASCIIEEGIPQPRQCVCHAVNLLCIIIRLFN